MIFVGFLIFSFIFPLNSFEMTERCSTNFDCIDRIFNSICSNGRCVCPEEYRFDGLARCIIGIDLSRFRRELIYGSKMLGEQCQWTTQCRQSPTDTNKVCVNYKCQCVRGFIGVDAFRCVRDFEPFSTPIRVTKSLSNEIPGFGSMCSTTSDCQQMTQDLFCLNDTCQCAQGYVPLGRYICYTAHAQMTNSIRTTTAATTMMMMTKATASHSASAMLPAVNSDVMRSLGKIGNPCINDYFCRRSVTQSHCYNGKCSCVDGYIAVDQYSCLKDMRAYTTTPSTLPPVEYKSLLGGPCVTKRNCHTSNAVCRELICSCPEDYFAVDDWSCLPEPESSDEELEETMSIVSTTTVTPLATTTTTNSIPTTTVFRWWPWSPTTITRQMTFEIPNSFRVRCLLNRQCASMDRNSHCTLFGRCICNRGYQLEKTDRGEHCVRQIINEDDCD